MESSFDVETFLRSLRATKPPWECPKCQKVYKSYSGMEYHLQNFDHTSSSTSTTPSKPTSIRKSKLKFTKRKKGHRFNRRSPSPAEFFYQTRDTLTWAEAQRMVEVESEGKVYRLNIDEKLDIISDSDIEKEDEISTDTTIKEEALTKDQSTPSKLKTGFHKNSKNVVSSPSIANHKLTSTSSGNSKKLPKPSYRQLSNYENETVDAPSRPAAYYRFIEKPPEEVEDEIEYDMDEEDTVWLEIINENRSKKGLTEVTHDQLELLMDRFEKESYFEQARNDLDVNGSQSSIDEDAVCCVCNDGECQNSNVILFCDMCNLAVHQECYGVPYIPEGQWLCRRCLQSPSCPVDCCLCPNRSGAFKQTDDGRWAHVVCALWVPEVGFGNTVFLEPIDGLKNVPPARWKLTCYVCKQRHSGACIQCHRTNCYVAFHVTCAQQAGLYMKMEVERKSGRNGVTSSVIKEAFCNSHSPTEAGHRFNGALKEGLADDKLKKTRKIIAERRNEAPRISIPHVPKNKITSISRTVNVQKKPVFIQRLLSYWTLKRQARNGVPLLRRLQSHVHQSRSNDHVKSSEQHQLIEQVKSWHRLRHELERVRLLIELIRKRERLKREIVRISQFMSELKLTPLLLVLRRVLDNLRDIDVAEVFAEPVTAKDAPDYHRVIKRPMDFSTMAEKIENHTYKRFHDFENDFNLMVNNCLEYNNTNTIFYRLGVKMRDSGGEIIRNAKYEVECTGYDCDVEASSNKAPEESAVEGASSVHEKIPLNKQLDELLLKLNEAISNKRKTKKIKSDIAAVRRKILHDGSGVTRRSMSRRYSADDAEATSHVAENDADVLSDVDCNFKVSPKIRPVAFKKTRSRKRLMSAKPSLEVCEPESKKSALERAISCPAPPDAVESDRESGLEEQQKVEEPPALDPPKVNTPPRHKSSSTSGSVSRRTAVLFKKKLRRGLSATAASGSSPAPQSPTPVQSPDSLVVARGASAPDNSDVETGDPKTAPIDSPSTIPNGFNTTYDENVFKEKPSLRRHESYTTFKPEVISVSDCAPSSERIAALKKKRSFSCSVTSLSPASQSSTATTLDDRTGLSDAELPFEYLRRQSYVSTTEDECDDEDLPQVNPLDLIWAKCRGYPPYPAMLIDPQMPRSGFCHNTVPIPSPPDEVLQIGDKRIENGNHRIYLVLFFDTKRTWQWLPRSKLHPLGTDDTVDRAKLSEGRRPGIRRNVEAAYKRALRHRAKVTGEIPDSDDEDAPRFHSVSSFFKL